jgi:hypothetical protein
MADKNSKYIYIYIYRERERETNLHIIRTSFPLGLQQLSYKVQVLNDVFYGYEIEEFHILKKEIERLIARSYLHRFMNKKDKT